MPIKFENFDGVTAPALPSGWTWAASLVTSASPTGGISPVSSPNVLALLAPGNNTHEFGVWGTTDGNGGDVTVSGDFDAASTTNNQTFGLLARASSTGVSSSSGTYYWLQLSPYGLVCRLYAVVSGSQTALQTVTLSSLAEPDWYLATLTLVGTALSATVQRVSDSYWLNGSGTFQSGAATAISVTDSSITGAGYAGLTLQSRSDNAYADNWTLSAASPVYLAPGALIARADRRRRPGRVKVGAAVPQPTPGTPLEGLWIAGAHPWHRGRAYLAPPSPAVDDPTRGLRLATILPLSSPRQLARGHAAIGPPSRPAPPEQTPLLGVIQAHRSPRRLAPGRAAAGTRSEPDPPRVVMAAVLASSPRRPTPGSVWLPAQPRSASDQGERPHYATARPAARPGDAIGRRPRGAVRLGWHPRIHDPPPRPTATRPVRRQGDQQARQQQGRAWTSVSPRWPSAAVPIHLPFPDGLWYTIYGNTGAGDPINYAAPLDSIRGTTWTTPALSAPGTWRFGVRAADAGGEEDNLDCAVLIVLDASGNDITNRPAPPWAIRAFARTAR